MKKIFISYCTKNKELADRLYFTEKNICWKNNMKTKENIF